MKILFENYQIFQNEIEGDIKLLFAKLDLKC